MEITAAAAVVVIVVVVVVLVVVVVTTVVTVRTNISIAIFGSFHPRGKRKAARMVFIPRLCELRGLEGGEWKEVM